MNHGPSRTTAILGGVFTSAVIATSLAAAPTASAADCVSHPNEPSVSCLRGNVIDSCDRDADGHYVYSRFRTTRILAPGFGSTGYDQNGSSPGCGNLPSRDSVTEIAICVQYEGCSGYKPV